MSTVPDPPDSGVSLRASAARGVDRACDRFEEDWGAGRRPRIEDYLGPATGPVRAVLLRELLTLDVEMRRRRGEEPAPADYGPRFPEDGELIAVVFRPAAPAPAAAGRLIGDYELLGELGRGGMGVVYRARQRALGRVVALKVIRADRLEDQTAERRREWLDRFHTEAKVAAQLAHEHLVEVYDAGEADGCFYYSMRLVEGTTLADLVADGRPLAGRRAAAYLEAVARAVQHAHEHGVLHRDLKPRNVLLQRQTDRPLVTDFGLAKLVGAVAGPTHTGDVLGSPPYLSPEQAGGGGGVGVAADVYGLGATLYHLLTGRPPFQAATLTQTLLQVLHAEPAPPRQLNPNIDRDLETITLRCLQKEPARRYQSAGELADDLGRYLRGEPIRARPVGRLGRLRRWCGRNPIQAGLLAAVALLLPAVTAVSVWAALEAGARARHEQRAAAEARAREEDEKQALLMQRLVAARQGAHTDGWSGDAWRLVLAARPDARLRDEAAATLAGLDVRSLRPFEGVHASAVAFDRAGRLLLGGTEADGGRPADEGRLWDGTEKPFRPSGRSGAGPVAFAPDGTPLQLAAGPGPCAVLWDVSNRRAICTGCFADPSGGPRPEKLARGVLGFAVLGLAADGSRFAAAGSRPDYPGLVAAWDARTGGRLFQAEADATALALAPDGSLLAAGDRQGRVTLWSVPDGEEVATLPSSGSQTWCLAFSPDGSRLAAGNAGGTATVWDWKARMALAHCRGCLYGVHALTFSPDGTLLASGGRGPTRLWDAATGRLLLDIRAGDFVAGLAFAPDGRRLAVGGVYGFGPGEVGVWAVEDGRGIRTLRGLAHAVTHVRFSADGGQLAALGGDWRVAVWDLRAGRLRRRLQAPPGLSADNAGMAFGQGGGWLVFAAGTEATWWDLATGAVRGSVKLPPGLADMLACHPSGRLMLLRSERPPQGGPHAYVLRDLLGPDPARLLNTVPGLGRILGAAAAPDGRSFLVESPSPEGQAPGQVVRCLDALTGAERWRLPIQGRMDPSPLCLDPAAEFVAVGFGPWRLVDMVSGRPVLPLDVRPFCLGPGAEWVVGDPRRPGFSLPRRGDTSPRVVLGIDTVPSFRPALSPDGRLLAWGNQDGTVTVCDLPAVRARLAEAGLGWDGP